ncbi:MAG TPA: 30S ribosomal protein S6 [Cyanobacteria bacterium UBA8530]|nr:30S ribosomal protein S6 [Cyanobacteria bacterium UBA8530]
MRNYETMYIIKPQLEEEAIDAVVKKFDDHIVKNGGVVEKIEKKGKKRLAYEVKDHRDGFYVLMNFQLDPGQITELDRAFKLSDEVIRHIVVRNEG